MGTWYEYAVVHDEVLVWWADLDGNRYNAFMPARWRDDFLALLDRQEREVQQMLQACADSGEAKLTACE